MPPGEDLFINMGHKNLVRIGSVLDTRKARLDYAGTARCWQKSKGAFGTAILERGAERLEDYAGQDSECRCALCGR